LRQRPPPVTYVPVKKEKNESEKQITHGQKMNALRTISRRILAAAVGEKSTHGQQEHDFADNVGLAAVKKKRKKGQKSTHGQQMHHFAATFSSCKV
jgi:hypothetical protein